MRQAAEMLGMRGKDCERSVLKLLRKREREIERQLVINVGGNGMGARYRVEQGALLEAFPRSRGDAMAEQLREVVDELRAENAVLKQSVAEAHAKIELLAKAVRKLKSERR